MKRMKKRIYAGTTCDQIVYTAPERSSCSQPQKPRFKNEEERERFNWTRARKHCARLVNANCTTAGYYCTLTFNAAHECHTFDEARKERRRFRDRLLRKNPDAVLFIFMGRGGSTSRIHFHMICDRVTVDEITNAWRAGEVIDIKRLREHNKNAKGEDLGTDFTAVSNYCFDHWTKEQGGRYYSATRNLKQPEEEEPTECIREYSLDKPPIAPKGYKYIASESYQTTYGYMLFKYVKIPAEPIRRRRSGAANNFRQ